MAAPIPTKHPAPGRASLATRGRIRANVELVLNSLYPNDNVLNVERSFNCELYMFAFLNFQHYEYTISNFEVHQRHMDFIRYIEFMSRPPYVARVVTRVLPNVSTNIFNVFTEAEIEKMSDEELKRNIIQYRSLGNLQDYMYLHLSQAAQFQEDFQKRISNIIPADQMFMLMGPAVRVFENSSYEDIKAMTDEDLKREIFHQYTPGTALQKMLARITSSNAKEINQQIELRFKTVGMMDEYRRLAYEASPEYINVLISMGQLQYELRNPAPYGKKGEPAYEGRFPEKRLASMRKRILNAGVPDGEIAMLALETFVMFLINVKEAAASNTAESLAGDEFIKAWTEAVEQEQKRAKGDYKKQVDVLKKSITLPKSTTNRLAELAKTNSLPEYVENVTKSLRLTEDQFYQDLAVIVKPYTEANLNFKDDKWISIWEWHPAHFQVRVFKRSREEEEEVQTEVLEYDPHQEN